MRAFKNVIVKIAPTDVPILLLGESGTGKEVLAAEIHRLSRKQNGPFIKVSFGPLSSVSFDEWLRGDNGFRSASSGTLFLNQIDELDPACQSKLLQALPDGDELLHEPCLSARLISATNQNLEGEVRAGRFRQDLYYRINGVCLRVPPLREREEDIPILIDFFLERFSRLFERPQPSVSQPTVRLLMNYSWPGNIRELENAVKKIVLLGEDFVRAADWERSLSQSPYTVGVTQGLSLKEASRAASREAEQKLILKALEQTHWNRKRAAKQLQISYKALLYKLKQLKAGDSAISLSQDGERR
jgi:DNA-binding NtrC family response regulator